MSHRLPVCRNETCPSFRSNKAMVVIQERREDVTFGCRDCKGIQVRTLDWRRAEQERVYQERGRPEYARTRAFFFQGRHYNG
jgi:hypothetical protein